MGHVSCIMLVGTGEERVELHFRGILDSSQRAGLDWRDLKDGGFGLEDWKTGRLDHEGDFRAYI